MKRFILFFILGFYVALGITWAQKLPVAEQEKIDILIMQFMETSHVPGIAISIAKSGELVFSKGYGWADVEQLVAVDPSQTKFRIASISKTLTADALMQLVEANKLDLDAPVQTYVPTFPVKRWPLTTRLVGGHLGGIRHYNGNEFLSTKYYPNVSEGLDIFQNDSLLFEPGTKYRYSSYGFNLVSAVIEGAASIGFLTYMQLNVFDELGMDNTVPDILSKIIEHRGRYYERTDGGVENSPAVDNSYKWAGGGFLSTSEDLIKFAKAHVTSGYLTEKSLRTLTTSQKTSDGKETKYGIGWRTDVDKEGYHWIGHTGGAVGGTSKFMIYPNEEIIVVVLTNLSSARLGDLPEQIARVAMNK
jgi:serine beta-lactamase-like protein LACTB, mitochondrial